MENKTDLEIITFKLPTDLKIKERARRILSLHFQYPKWTHKEIGEAVGVSTQRVQQILSHPKVLAAMPYIGKQRVKALIPKAVKRYGDLIDGDNAITAERAAARVLTDQKVFDAPETKVVGEITLKSVTELRDIIEKASQLPQNVIDAEVVSGDEDQVA